MRIISIILSFAIISTVAAWADEKPFAVSIKPRLGLVFGKLIEIEGRIVDDTDKHLRVHLGKKLISIHSIGDRDLASPVIMELRIFTFTSVTIPKRGVWVRFRGYETGGFSGIPYDAFKDVPVVATDDHHFESFFQVTKKLKPSKAEPDTPRNQCGTHASP
ncbi:MAG: hypothetical protein ABIK92_06995 [Pseudomonadota bacterium]